MADVTKPIQADTTPLSGAPPPPQAKAPGIAAIAPVVAGYEIVRPIGSGGMGVVWEAIELRFDRRVALKVRSRFTLGEGEDTEELFREAKLAAKLEDPGIVRVLDMGIALSGAPYYTMDLVRGTDLASVLASSGALPQTRVLQLAVDLTRAVSVAHAQGVVHCDLKPRNVMVDADDRVRVLDFGIARRMDTHTERGSFEGSPHYMAPEQWTNGELGPPTDVFAIGLILYEMLGGRRANRGATMQDILADTVHGQYPSLTDLAPHLSPELLRIIDDCLARDPILRHPDARALYEDLRAVQEGRDSAMSGRNSVRGSAPRSRHPYSLRPGSVAPPSSSKVLAARVETLPKVDESWQVFSWTWELSSTPEQLWPYVANTDRFNRAIGLSPATFSDVLQDGRLVRRGETTAVGMRLVWDEHPFEWIRAREHTVFRRYHEGPLELLINGVKLAPRAGGGTSLTHTISVKARNVIGRVASVFEIGHRVRRAAERVYRAIDAALRTGSTADPFEPPHHPNALEEERIANRTCDLTSRYAPPRLLVDKLQDMLRRGAPQAVAEIRAYELARAWGHDPRTVFELCSHASAVGLLAPTWNSVCPVCGTGHESCDALEKVTPRARCASCGHEYERDLSRSVEMVFTPHAEVRAVPKVTYCVGAPTRRAHVVAQKTIGAGDELTLTLELAPGTYSVRALPGANAPEFVVSARAGGSDVDIHMTATTLTASRFALRAGPVTLRIVSDAAQARTLCIEEQHGSTDRLSANEALLDPTFRGVHKDERIEKNGALPVANMAFMAVELASEQALFATQGDRAAFDAVVALEKFVAREVNRAAGTLLPTQMGTMLAAFASVDAAVDCAIAVLGSEDRPYPVRIACHEGEAFAVSRDPAPSYYGRSVHLVRALASECAELELVLTDRLLSQRSVMLKLHGSGYTTRVVGSQNGVRIGICTQSTRSAQRSNAPAPGTINLLAPSLEHASTVSETKLEGTVRSPDQSAAVPVGSTMRSSESKISTS